MSSPIKSVREIWADTTTAHSRLMLTVVGGLAEFQRELIRSRTSEGRERAKAKWVVGPQAAIDASPARQPLRDGRPGIP